MIVTMIIEMNHVIMVRSRGRRPPRTDDTRHFIWMVGYIFDTRARAIGMWRCDAVNVYVAATAFVVGV